MDWVWAILKAPSVTDWFIVGLTGAYVFVTNRQLRAMRDGLATSNRNAAAAETGAQAALAQVEAARDQAQPWPVFDVDEMMGWPKEGERPTFPLPLEFRWSVKNYGNGPAWMTYGVTGHGVLKFPLPDAPPADPAGQQDFVKIMLPPGKQRTIVSGFGMTELNYGLIMNREAAMVCWSTLRYRDVYGRRFVDHIACTWKLEQRSTPQGPIWGLVYNAGDPPGWNHHEQERDEQSLPAQISAGLPKNP